MCSQRLIDSPADTPVDKISNPQGPILLSVQDDTVEAHISVESVCLVVCTDHSCELMQSVICMDGGCVNLTLECAVGPPEKKYLK